MRAECSQVAQAATVRIKVVEQDNKAFVEAEFVNNFSAPLWIAQEASPAYRVDPQSGAVVISYGYFEDVYGPFRGRYMLPPMKRVLPGAILRWRIDEPVLLKKLFAPGIVAQLRVRAALAEFPASNVRGRQPLAEYLEASCPVESPATVLGKSGG